VEVVEVLVQEHQDPVHLVQERQHPVDQLSSPEDQLQVEVVEPYFPVDQLLLPLAEVEQLFYPVDQLLLLPLHEAVHQHQHQLQVFIQPCLFLVSY